jgi:hypothetical protein
MMKAEEFGKIKTDRETEILEGKKKLVTKPLHPSNDLQDL